MWEGKNIVSCVIARSFCHFYRLAAMFQKIVQAYCILCRGYCSSTRLDGNCKKWRLFADILNDMAMALELLVPMFLTYSTHILCIATALKSIVGVAGGATRAAITQHQV
jgi:hypothetical protein